MLMQSVYRRMFHYTLIIDASVGLCVFQSDSNKIFYQMYTHREVSDVQTTKTSVTSERKKKRRNMLN